MQPGNILPQPHHRLRKGKSEMKNGGTMTGIVKSTGVARCEIYWGSPSGRPTGLIFRVCGDRAGLEIELVGGVSCGARADSTISPKASAVHFSTSSSKRRAPQPHLFLPFIQGSIPQFRCVSAAENYGDDEGSAEPHTTTFPRADTGCAGGRCRPAPLSIIHPCLLK